MENDVYWVRKMVGTFNVEPIYDRAVHYSFGGGNPVGRHVTEYVCGHRVSLEKLIFSLEKWVSQAEVSISKTKKEFHELIRKIQEIDETFDLVKHEMRIEENLPRHYERGKIEKILSSPLGNVRLKGSTIEPIYKDNCGKEIERGEYLTEKCIHKAKVNKCQNECEFIFPLLGIKGIDWERIKEELNKKGNLEGIMILAQNELVSLDKKEQEELKNYLFFDRRTARLEELEYKKAITLTEKDKTRIKEIHYSKVGFSYR